MGRIGEYGQIDIDANEEQRALALAVRSLLKMRGLSLRKVEVELREQVKTRRKRLEQLRTERDLTATERLDLVELAEGRFFSKSALEELVKGRRKHPPRESELRELYDFAHGGHGSREGWEELLFKTIRSVRDQVCPACGTAAAPTKECAGAKPAENVAVIAPGGAPVPISEGDRRNEIKLEMAWPSIAEVVWSPVIELSEYVSAGKLENANGLMRHVGIEADPLETADAIVACRQVDMSDAADTIIGHAGNRKELVDVARILKSLNDRDRRADGDALLDHVLK